MATLYETMIRIGVDASEVEKYFGQAEDRVRSFGDTAKGVFVGNLIYDGVKKIGSAVVELGKSSVETGMNFDKAMSQVQATMLKSNEEMEASVGSVDTAYGHFEGNLREFSQFLGENTAFSATQAAEALNYMALAGYSTQESMDMLPNVLSLAAAGNMDLARASDMVTDTQTAFGLNAERTAQMVNEMAKAASTGNTSVEQLGDGFLRIGGLAKELNGGFVTLADGTQAPVDGIQELEIAMTAMANSGVKGSEAGTHMRNMLMKLSGPTADGTKALEAMGVTVFDAEGKMRSLSDIFGDLNTAMSDMTQEQRIQTIQDLFNARDLASAQAILGAIGEDWDKIGESILNADGAAAEMAKIQLDNLSGDMTLFKSAVEGAQIAISDRLSPALRKFVQGGTSLVQTFSKTFRENGVQGVIDAGVEMIKGFVGGISESMPEIISSAVETVATFAENLQNNVDAIAGVGVDLITAVMDGLRDSAPILMSYAGELITGFAEWITEGLDSITEVGIEIINFLAEGISEFLPELIPIAMNALMTFSGSLRENVGEIVDAGLNLIMTLADSLIQNLPVFIETVPTIVSNIAGIINDNAPKLLAAGVTLIVHLVQGIIDSVPTLIAEFPKIIKMIFDVWGAINWTKMGTDVIKFIGTGIKNLAKNIPTALRNIGHEAVQWMKLIKWSSLGRDVIDLILIGIRALVSAIPNLLKTIGSTALNIFKSINWRGLGHTVITFIVNGIRSLISQIPNTLRTIGQTAMNTFKNINWASVGSAVVSGIANGIRNGASSIVNAAQNAASRAFNAAKSFLGIASPSKLFRDRIGKMVSLGLAEGIEDNADEVEDAMTGLAALTTDPFGNSYSTEQYGSTRAFGQGDNITINVYPREHQDERQIADEVQQILAMWQKQKEAVFA